jgi:hypothetical protein
VLLRDLCGQAFGCGSAAPRLRGALLIFAGTDVTSFVASRVNRMQAS